MAVSNPNRFPRLPLLALIGLMAAGCAGTRVDDDSPQSPEVTGQDMDRTRPLHVVRAGETLWSIAWRYQVDVDDLANWNGLANPDLIIVGQSLFLAPGLPSSAGEPISAQSAAQPSQAWQWPVRGPVVSAYGASASTGKGIGIGGDIGADVRAAGAGQVVYAGDGLAAYGNLIIIKHDEMYLSAYGQNDRLLVGDGDWVGTGQLIAKMGLGPERQPHVHFEIRRYGVPVDPLSLLPATARAP